ncbi:uncharacterized protein [Musca autumnalis]|uniref:uncharacterized protein n=1 Tax=Musca autumnalis TaxID=221902 RepID=UPI003CFBA605
MNNNEMEKYIMGVYEQTSKYLHNYKEKIIITTADKGNKTVILYKDENKSKMSSLLEDKTTYKTCRIDPTEKLQRTNNNLVTELYKNNYITKMEKFKLICHTAEAPQLYGLPKIHKDNVPLRPISSSTQVPCYNISHYIGKILKNIISKDYNIKNSVELKEKLNAISFDKDDILVSFDIVSLFTNIPIHLAIKNILDKWEILQKHTTIPKRRFLVLLQFCLIDNNYFKYDETTYTQTYGMPMGNPLSPTIADIVLDTLLDEVLNELKQNNMEIKLISKYVDDIFAIIDRKYKETTLKLLNLYHTKIQFTVELEKDKKLPYLDMTVIKDNNKIKSNWYSKPTSSGRILNYHSTQPKSMNINTANNLINKIFFLSNKEYQNQNKNKITEILLKNNYPKHTINKLINKQLENLRNDQQKIKDEEIKHFYSVPFIPKLTNRNALRTITTTNESKTTIAYKSNYTLQKLFTKRNRTDKLKQCNVVYEITCYGKEGEPCNKVYVGTTKRMLSTRINEHEADVRKGKESTALSQHMKECGHNANFSNVKILDREQRENKRYTLESLRIQERIHKSINTKEDKDNTKLQYSVAII